MKPLTIEQLKVLPVQDWIYVIDKVIVSKEYKRILDKTDDKLFLPEPRRYKDYGTKWVAYKNKEQAECKGDLYKTAFELILQDVYETRLQADILSCSSCPFMFELFDGCENQGLYEDCKRRWNDYYLAEAERRLAELTNSKYYFLTREDAEKRLEELKNAERKEI